MNINHAVNLNLSMDAIPPRLHMAQGDSNSRSIVAALWVGADAFAIPAGATAMVRFGKPDNTGGLYDTTEGGKKVTFSGNTVTAPVAAQMLAVPGIVAAQIEIYGASGSGTSSERLASFRFFVDVEESAYSDAAIISSDYFNVLASEITAASAAASDAEAWAKGTRNGVAVSSDDPAYHNNAKYWSDNTGGIDLSSDRATGTLPLSKGGTGAATAAGARTALGLGALATKGSVSLAGNDVSGTLPVAKGGTGVTTLAALLTAMGVKDYVVEQGTTAKTGITWTWKKWNSGFAEIDGITDLIESNCNTEWGTGCYVPAADGVHAGPYDFPFTLTDAVSMPFNIMEAYNAWLCTYQKSTSVTTKTPSWDPVRCTAATVKFKLAIHVVGKWK